MHALLTFAMYALSSFLCARMPLTKSVKVFSNMVYEQTREGRFSKLRAQPRQVLWSSSQSKQARESRHELSATNILRIHVPDVQTPTVQQAFRRREAVATCTTRTTNLVSIIRAKMPARKRSNSSMHKPLPQTNARLLLSRRAVRWWQPQGL